MMATRVEELNRRSGAGERALRSGRRTLWPYLGPAFIACVAYMDPGNFATNIAGGSKFGYTLAWVIVASSLMAMLIQTLSAKLGIATGRNLPEVCREQYSRRTSFALWVQAELIAMATDLAEFLGAAVGIKLLLGIPLFPAAVITGVITFLILGLQRFGFRPLEAVIAAFVAVIGVCYLAEIWFAHPPLGTVAKHAVVPDFAGNESLLLAVGIIGATVMPHVIYLHSALTQRRIVGRNEREKRQILRFERIDVVIAMALAGAVNLSMMIMAAALFNGSGLVGIDSIDGAYDGLKQLVSPGAATIFGIALLASGYASSSVGTMSGQVVMQGFIRRRIPIFARRAITLAPALIVLALGIDPTDALVGSQVVLSFGIPFALVPLVMLTRKPKLMGSLASPRWLTVLASILSGLIIALNVFLLEQVFIG
ncbi:MAG: Nramp family divalent metal transporter [Gaiellaceae bacterium]